MNALFSWKLTATLSLILAATLLPAVASAGLIFQSATQGFQSLPAVALQNDLSLQQASGVHFQVTSTVQITAIGASLDGTGILFGEIYALSGPTGLPSGDPFNTVPLARVNFTPAPDDFLDFLLPLSITLDPGSYGLVFGATAGATGNMPTTGTDFPGINTFSYFFYQAGLLSFKPSGFWQNAGSDNERFIIQGTVVGTAVPEPGSIGLGIVGLLLVLAIDRNIAKGGPLKYGVHGLR